MKLGVTKLLEGKQAKGRIVPSSGQQAVLYLGSIDALGQLDQDQDVASLQKVLRHRGVRDIARCSFGIQIVQANTHHLVGLGTAGCLERERLAHIHAILLGQDAIDYDGSSLAQPRIGDLWLSFKEHQARKLGIGDRIHADELHTGAIDQGVNLAHSRDPGHAVGLAHRLGQIGPGADVPLAQKEGLGEQQKVGLEALVEILQHAVGDRRRHARQGNEDGQADGDGGSRDRGPLRLADQVALGQASLAGIDEGQQPAKNLAQGANQRRAQHQDSGQKEHHAQAGERWQA